MKKNGLFLKLCIILILSPPLLSQSKLIKSVGIGGGLSTPQGEWDPGFSIRAQTDFGEILDYLFLFPFINYSQAHKTETLGDISKDLTIQYLGGGVKLVGYVNSKPQGFYCGGSLSYHYIQLESFNPENSSKYSEIDQIKTTKIGFSGLAGYLFILKPLSIFLEADYVFMQNNLNNLSVYTGINFNIR